MSLRTRYLGLDLDHPIVASASPLSRTLAGVKQLEDAGAAAIVLFSLFEEQLSREQQAYDHFTEVGAESYSESLSYFPDMMDYEVGPQAYLALIQAAREACDVPIIASLNGISGRGWVNYARDIEQAGASALELNVYYLPTDMRTTGVSVERRYQDVVAAVRDEVSIPIAVKLGPYFSSPAGMARRMVDHGADGLVLFNRFYQPDFDIDAMEVTPQLELSTRAEMRLPLLWIAVLHGKVTASLAATTGVTHGEDAARYLLAGADVVMTTSELLRNGPERLGGIREELVAWMDRKRFDSVATIKGAMSQAKVADPEAFERANYIRTLQSWR